ncbi:allophanate hydrolase-related protein [Dactylosporangium salmoneum]|uniref:Glutamyl-tRNA amidotransferase n=1 Tax=Dactylosporangium salmoneum TaxID=53361 RepID=A0ABP5TVD8_9ACTN
MRYLLAVNGTLMRGLELNQNLVGNGAVFVKETETAPEYRVWTINDVHPAMIRTPGEGGAVALEVWEVPAAALADILSKEPAGLTVGKVALADGSEVLGVLGEPFLVEGQREITEFGGWRGYLARKERMAP